MKKLIRNKCCYQCDGIGKKGNLLDIVLNTLIGLMVICLFVTIYLLVCVAIQVGIVEVLLTLLACSIVIIIAALIGTIIAKLFDIFD